MVHNSFENRVFSAKAGHCASCGVAPNLLYSINFYNSDGNIKFVKPLDQSWFTQGGK